MCGVPSEEPQQLTLDRVVIKFHNKNFEQCLLVHRTYDNLTRKMAEVPERNITEPGPLVVPKDWLFKNGELRNRVPVYMRRRAITQHMEELEEEGILPPNCHLKSGTLMRVLPFCAKPLHTTNGGHIVLMEEIYFEIFQ